MVVLHVLLAIGEELSRKVRVKFQEHSSANGICNEETKKKIILDMVILLYKNRGLLEEFFNQWLRILRTMHMSFSLIPQVI